MHCPKIVHGCHYPIAPKLDFLQSQDHAAFQKGTTAVAYHLAGPTSPAVISPHDVISLFQADGILPVTVGLTLPTFNLQT